MEELRVKDFEYLEPVSLQQALEWLNTHRGRARVLAGGTDLYLRLRKRVFVPDYVIDLKRVRGLDYIASGGQGGLRIGPTALQGDVYSSPLVQEGFPALAEAARLVGSVQTRNRATVVGNLCNASPAADTAPALMGYGAQVKIASLQGERTVPLEEFFVGPAKTALQDNELVAEVLLPAPLPRTGGSFVRRTRTAMDIAVVCGAAVLSLANGRCREVRIALGAVAPTPIRAPRAEGALRGQALTERLIEEASRIAAEEARPIDDVRSTAEYRREMVHVLTRRGLTQALARARAR
ncbi:MAG: xanthine dehydrogenase family protein subunit M [Nitrospinae bacterium]|nr:xanthine dehydrogenase family protein subunit M [Nitrospinota bacterium]